jgi:type I restriction enzyme S subunit
MNDNQFQDIGRLNYLHTQKCWEIKHFEDVFINDTKHARKIKNIDYLPVGQNPIIDQGKNMVAGYSDESDGIYQTDTPVIAFGDHTRIIKYLEMPFFLGADGVKLLAPKIKVNVKYLYYFLNTVYIPDTGYDRHYKYLNNIKIPLPPIEIQKQIAEALDKASELIEKRKQQIKLLDDFVKSVFVEMFGDPVINPMGWEIEKLGILGELNRGVSKHRPRNDPVLLEGRHPLIQTGDVANSDLYINSYNQTYSDIGLQQSKIWRKGTLCITIAANIAKTAILNFNACFPDSVVGFIPSKRTNNFFIHYWFSFFQKILEQQAPESAQKNINLKILNDLDVICPKLQLQNQFTAIVEQTEKQKALLNDGLEKMKRNYKSIMQKAFNGGLFEC